MSNFKNFTILQATAQTSSHLIKRLLASNANINIKAAVRSPSKLTIDDKRVTKVKLDLFNQQSVSEALKGSQALFIVAPTAYGGRDHSEAVIEWSEILRKALKENTQVERLVLVSSIGADVQESGPPIAALGDAERVLSSSTKEVIFLRPPAYLENHKEAINYAKEPPYQFMSTIDPAELAFPQISTRLIAQAAEKYLTSTFNSAKALNGNLIVELLTKPTSAVDIAKVLDKLYQLPKPVSVGVIPQESFQAVFEQKMDPKEAANWAAVMKAANRGVARSVADDKGNYPPGVTSETLPFDLEQELRALL